MKIEWINIVEFEQGVTPLHEVQDTDLVDTLVEGMLVFGWVGRPLLLSEDGFLWTGSHRFAALQKILAEVVSGELPDDALELSAPVVYTDYDPPYEWARNEDLLDELKIAEPVDKDALELFEMEMDSDYEAV